MRYLLFLEDCPLMNGRVKINVEMVVEEKTPDIHLLCMGYSNHNSFDIQKRITYLFQQQPSPELIDYIKRSVFNDLRRQIISEGTYYSNTADAHFNIDMYLEKIIDIVSNKIQSINSCNFQRI